LNGKNFPKANFIECPNLAEEGYYLHLMRDGCFGCAPYWEYIAKCPIHDTILRQSDSSQFDINGKYTPGNSIGFCRNCKKHYNIERE